MAALRLLEVVDSDKPESPVVRVMPGDQMLELMRIPRRVIGASARHAGPIVCVVAFLSLVAHFAHRPAVAQSVDNPTKVSQDSATKQQRVRAAATDVSANDWWKKRAHLLDLIFPKSAKWTRFDALPTAPFVAGRVPKLLREMGFAPPSDPQFYAGLADGFRLVAIQNGSALVYSGPAPDAEGDRTVVWPDYPSGTPWPHPGQGAWAVRIMRVQSGSNPRVVAISEGCCADPEEAFYRSDLIDPDGAEIVPSSKMLEIPDRTTDLRLPVNLPLGCILRFSPMIDDNPLADQTAVRPRIGNIARKYAGIFDAVALMAHRDAGGRWWILIRTTVEDDAASTYSDPLQSPVELGWIDATPVMLSPNNKELRLKLTGQ